MGQKEEDKTPGSHLISRPLLLDPVISFLDEDLKSGSQAWDKKTSVPTFTPGTNQSSIKKPQVSFEDAYHDHQAQINEERK